MQKEEKKNISMSDIRAILGELIGTKLSSEEIQEGLASKISNKFVTKIQQRKFKHQIDDLLSISIAVFKNNEDDITTAFFGKKDPLQTDEFVDSNTPYNIGSISKFMIMVMVLRLVKNCLFSLDDSIDKFLNLKAIPNSDKITIRHLLGHYSGLKDSGFAKFEKDDPIEIMLNTATSGQQGENFYYSNVNYIILSKIIEASTKKSLEQNLAELVLMSLGMNHTYMITEKCAEDYAEGYKYNSGAEQLMPASNFYIWGATNIRSTPSDLVILIHNFFNNDNFISSSLRDEIVKSCHSVMFEVKTNEATFRWPASMGYGIERHEIKRLYRETCCVGYCYGHGGWQDSNAAFLVYCPDIQTAYCVTCSKTQGLEKKNKLEEKLTFLRSTDDAEIKQELASSLLPQTKAITNV